MTQVILYLSPSGLGNVAVCTPSGEVPIDQVLSRVISQGFSDAFITDTSILPTGSDAQFFDAWELSGSTVTVNLEKARAIKLVQYNAQATQEAQKRQLNTLTGIANDVSDADFIAKLTADRTAIANATSTAELLAI